MNCKYKYNLSAFLNEDNVSFYLLGAFLADGWIDNNKNRVCFGSTDFEWIEKIRNIICPDLYIRVRKTKAKDFYQICINNIILYKWFMGKGFTSDKSLNIKMPNVPDKFFLDFLLGCIDGDGFTSFVSKKPIVGISSGSKVFLDELHIKLNAIGIKCKVGKKWKPKTQKIMGVDCKSINDHFYLKVYNHQALKLIDLMYQNSDFIPFLSRKKEVAEQIKLFYFNKISNGVSK